jgi:hypothetical protein
MQHFNEAKPFLQFYQSGSFKINIKTPAREYGGSPVEYTKFIHLCFGGDCTFKRESTKKDDLFYTPAEFSLADTLAQK